MSSCPCLVCIAHWSDWDGIGSSLCEEQVFEVEDPEGPLDTTSEDIGQQFGRLQLKTAAELGLPAQQLSELAAAQSDTPQPSLQQDLELWKQHVGIQPGNGDISKHP